MENKYDVVIVGGGISGSALAYLLSRYTNIKKIAILEKYDALSSLNSSGKANSQTIHFGDIETNYTLEKAKVTKKTAKMVEKYCLQYNLQNKVMFSHQKMALGVGPKEVEFMLERYEEFKNLFPNLQVWTKEHLKEIEPKLIYDENGKEREDIVVGVGSQGEWTTVDYQKLSISFIENSKKQSNIELDVFTNTNVEDIKKIENSYVLKSENNQTFYANFVVVNAGAHSLYLAHKMGVGLHYATLPVAGSFYMTMNKLLLGKVYMVQNPKLPFAALHGDPDICNNEMTRFGPTALLIPRLERFNKNTAKDFWTTLKFDKNIFTILFNLMKDSDIRNYIFRNFLFEIPFLNKILFVGDAKKIIPSLKASEIEYAKGFGGVRPQVLDKKEKKLMLGEASLNTNDGIIFNMTPSPGATSCLGNAKRDVQIICEFLGKTFDIDLFNNELIEDISLEIPEDLSQKVFISQLRKEIYEYEKKFYTSVVDCELPSYWGKPYNPWRNKRDHWSF